MYLWRPGKVINNCNFLFQRGQGDGGYQGPTRGRQRVSLILITTKLYIHLYFDFETLIAPLQYVFMENY